MTDFENRAGLFPDVHRSFKFCLLTLGRDEHAPRFAFFLTRTAQLDDPERAFTLSPEKIAALNPNTRTAPVFRSRADAELTAKIYAKVPVLVDEGKGAAGNPWGVSFLRMFDMAGDSHLFRTAADLAGAGFVRDGNDWVAPEGDRATIGPAPAAFEIKGGGGDHQDGVSPPASDGGGPRDRSAATRYVPLYEAKMVHLFDHRWAGYAGDGGTSAEATGAQKRDPAWEPAPRYWVPRTNVKDHGSGGWERGVDERLLRRDWKRGWLMGWRDITNATNERTLISSVIPRVACGDEFLIMMPGCGMDKISCLYANLCSIPADFSARQKVGGTHLKYFLMRQIPILPPEFYRDGHIAFITPRILELTYTSHSLAPFARDLGYDGPPFDWDGDRRARLRAELDAFYARAYGLIRDELRYILDPADVKGADHPSETFRILKEKEIRRHGEYRTRRLILEVWDRMEANGEFESMGM